MSNYSTHHLSNGLTVHLLKLSTIPAIYTRLVVRSGSRNESNASWGYSHFVEHLMAHKIEAAFRQHPWIDPYMLETFDAETDVESTSFWMSFKCGDEKFLATLLKQVFTEQNYKQVDIKAQQVIVGEELLVHLDDPRREQVQQILNKLYYSEPALTRDSSLGTPTVIENITKESLQRFTKQNFTTRNSTLYVCGDFNEVELLNSLESLSPQNTSVVELKNRSIKAQSYACKSEVSDNISEFSYAATIPHQNDLAMVLSVDIMTEMLQNYLISANVAEGICYEISVAQQVLSDHVLLAIDAQIDSTKIDVLEAWLKAKVKSFSQELTEADVKVFTEKTKTNLRLESYYPLSQLNSLAWSDRFLIKPISIEQELVILDKIKLDDILRFLPAV